MPPFLQRISHHNVLKYQLSKSFCSSYRWNVRNLERPWYSLWNSVLVDLTEGFNNMVVAAQFPLWFSPSEDDHLSDVDEDEGYSDNGNDSEDELYLPPPEERDPGEQEEQEDDTGDDEAGDEECVEGDTTTDSLATIPDKQAAELFPDFVIIHLLAKRIPKRHPRFERLSGVQITHQCCPVVVEVKRYPPRKDKGVAFHSALRLYVAQARSDLGYQCYHLFQQYPHAVSTIAVAASGDCWTHLIVYRNQVPKVVGDYFDTSAWDKLPWPYTVTLGSKVSDARLKEIHDDLKCKPRLDLGN